jgi:hypothetical protein
LVEDRESTSKHQERFRREVDGEAEIPGRDPFEIVLAGQRLSEQGILVHANVVKGFEGVVRIHEYCHMEDVQIHDSRPEVDQVRMNVELGASRELDLAYEHPNSSQKDRDPVTVCR